MKTKGTSPTYRKTNPDGLLMLRRDVFVLCLFLTACVHSGRPALQDLAHHEDLSGFKIQSVQGVRDGDRLNAQVLISDSSSILTLDLHFAIGSPSRLESGDWRWARPGHLLNGTVSARSVTFLGGQDGPPSIGGTFDLAGPDGSLYRVIVPLTVLPRPVPRATSDQQHH
ncbi:MAG: hypothetical protein JOZ32_16560 [Bryobacterales bacterium]|nr:hypothetical protein [Bryobacterales bacterium]